MTSPVVVVLIHQAFEVLRSRLRKDATEEVWDKFRADCGQTALPATGTASGPGTPQWGPASVGSLSVVMTASMDDVMAAYAAAMESAGWTETEVRSALVEMQQALLALPLAAASTAPLPVPSVLTSAPPLDSEAQRTTSSSEVGEAHSVPYHSGWRERYKRPSRRPVVVVSERRHDLVPSFTDEDMYRMSWGALSGAGLLSASDKSD